MSARRARRSLLWQFTAFGVLPSVSVLALVIGINGYRMLQHLEEAAQKSALTEAAALAHELDGWNRSTESIVSIMVHVAECAIFGDRAESLQLMQSVLEAHPEFEGCYYTYEPNADGHDAVSLAALRAHSLGALPAESLGPTGRFLPYLFRNNAKGREISLKIVTDEDVNQYYQGPKKRFEANGSIAVELTEPYAYEGVLMTECTKALVVHGKFAGIAGIDRGLDILQKKLQGIATRTGLNVMLLTAADKFIVAARGDRENSEELSRAYADVSARPLLDTPWGKTIAPMLNEESNSSIQLVTNPLTGDETWHARSRVALGGWDVVVEVPYSLYKTDVGRSLMINLLIGLTGLAIMLVLLLRMAVKLSRRIRVAASAARDVADGDLTRSYEVQGMDEAGELLGSMNDMTRRLNDLVCRVRGVTLNISGTATQMSGSSRQQEEVAQSFGSSSSEIAAAVRQISTTGSELLKNMERLAVSAGESSQMAVQGREGLQAMGKTMDELASATGGVADRLAAINEKARSINAIVDTITKVADQTNLLSVNAAIEAEKAGASGRGFLVVAREIRRLADQTAAATLDIETTVQQMQTAVSGGVMEMDRFRDQVHRGVDNVATVGQCLTQVIDRVGMAEGQFAQVTEGMQSQVQGAQQIRQSMDALAQNASRAREATAEFAQAATTLQDSLTQLRAAVGLFRLRDAT